MANALRTQIIRWCYSPVSSECRSHARKSPELTVSLSRVFDGVMPSKTVPPRSDSAQIRDRGVNEAKQKRPSACPSTYPVVCPRTGDGRENSKTGT